MSTSATRPRKREDNDPRNADMIKSNKAGNVLITLSGVRATAVAVEKQVLHIVCVCVCVCVCVTLVIQHTMRTRHIVICGLSRSTISFNSV